MNELLDKYMPNIVMVLLIAGINIGIYMATVSFMNVQLADLKVESRRNSDQIVAVQLQIAAQLDILSRVEKIEARQSAFEAENIRFWREDWPKVERIINELDRRK